MKIVNLIAALSLAAFAATFAYAADDKKEDKDKSATTSQDKDKSKAASSGTDKAGSGATTKPEEKKPEEKKESK